MIDLLPPNSTNLERALAVAVQTPALPTVLHELWSAEDCPPAILPWLAWSLSVDSWQPGWSVETRRAVVANSIAHHRIKGTTQSVEDAVAALGVEADIVEWFERTPAGDPHTFCLVIDLSDDEGAPPSEAYLDTVYREVIRTKPVRSHFNLTQKQNAAGGIGFAAAGRPAAYLRLSMEIPEEA